MFAHHTIPRGGEGGYANSEDTNSVRSRSFRSGRAERSCVSLVEPRLWRRRWPSPAAVPRAPQPSLMMPAGRLFSTDPYCV